MRKLIPSELTELDTFFDKGLNTTDTHYTTVATVLKGGNVWSMYKLIKSSSAIKRMIDEELLDAINKHGCYEYTLHKDFKETVHVDSSNMDCDDIDVYESFVRELGRRTALVPDQLVFRLLSRGTLEKCYDNKPFFSTDHPVGSSTISNLDEGNGIAWYLLDCSAPLKPLMYQEHRAPELNKFSTAEDTYVSCLYSASLRCSAKFGFWQMAYCSKKPLNIENFNKAYVSMQYFTDNDGIPLNITPTHLVVPPSLEREARMVLCQTLPNGASNPCCGAVEVIVSPYIEDEGNVCTQQ